MLARFGGGSVAEGHKSAPAFIGFGAPMTGGKCEILQNVFADLQADDCTKAASHTRNLPAERGAIQARCSRISADVTAMIAACKDFYSIIEEHRSQIEASGAALSQERAKRVSPPKAAPPSSSTICYPKGALHLEASFESILRAHHNLTSFFLTRRTLQHWKTFASRCPAK
jgi:hypothetical protein